MSKFEYYESAILRNFVFWQHWAELSSSTKFVVEIAVSYVQSQKRAPVACLHREALLASATEANSLQLERFLFSLVCGREKHSTRIPALTQTGNIRERWFQTFILMENSFAGDASKLKGKQKTKDIYVHDGRFSIRRKLFSPLVVLVCVSGLG